MVGRSPPGREARTPASADTRQMRLLMVLACLVAVSCSRSGKPKPEAGEPCSVFTGCAHGHFCAPATGGALDGTCKKCPMGVHESGDCEASAEGCRKGERCEAFGECSAVPVPKDYPKGDYRLQCRVQSDLDCRGSLACKSEGKCSRVVDPDASEPRCGATSDSDCRATLACQDNGRCWARGDQCVPLSVHDCATSTGCIDFGKCGIDGGFCVRGPRPSNTPSERPPGPP